VSAEAEREMRRTEREAVGCAGALSLLFLVSLAVVFIGCPGAVSYDISRGCAAGAEVGR
jgi:hypothetical protein